MKPLKAAIVPAISALAFFLVAAPAIGAGSKGGLKGEDVFNAYCARCHGRLGVGTDKGPPLVHRIYEPNHHSDLSFRWAIERGVRAHHWAFGDMPKIEGLGPEDADAIIVYVRSLQKEAGI